MDGDTLMVEPQSRGQGKPPTWLPARVTERLVVCWSWAGFSSLLGQLFFNFFLDLKPFDYLMKDMGSCPRKNFIHTFKPMTSFNFKGFLDSLKSSFDPGNLWTTGQALLFNY